jgi:hypothetical protein
MPKQDEKKKKLRRSERKSARKSTAQSVRRQYMSKRPKRATVKPTVFSPCAATNTYNRGWPPPTVDATAVIMGTKLAANQDIKANVEELGDKGAKWYLSNQLLGKNVEDGDRKQPFKDGYFYSFSGAHTFDSVYVDASTGHVYVIEAKGTKKNSSANLIKRQNGKQQGSFNYLDEVAAEMQNSNDPLKVAAANKILNAPPGKLHYVGVQTTYSTDAGGRVDVQTPKRIFKQDR